jgi:broad specificity phosphatase PhoE
MAVEILYETHAVSTDNEAGIASGWLPGELSPTGRQLATRRGERHRTRTIAAVFASDLARAVQTARIAASDEPRNLLRTTGRGEAARMPGGW